MKCVIYCRVSTDRQREAGTIESQREALLQFARVQNWTVVSVEEDDGFSGTVPAWERPGMSRALRLIESRSVDYLLVVDLDRTSRAEDPFERAIVRKALRDHGVLLATPKGILRDITPEEKLTQDMLSSVASYERSKTRERTVRGRKDAVLRKGGRPLTQTPLGLQWSPETHGYIASPVEAPVVREIFRLATEGMGPLQIERELVRRNMPSGRMQRYRPRGTPKGTPKELGTKFIVRRSIQDMLANPVFCSERWAPNPAWDPNFTVSVEPIVTREQWDAANAALQGRPRPVARPLKYDYLLRAVVFCAHCKRKMRGQTTVKDRNMYYRCEFANRPQVNCDRCTARGSIRADQLEAVVWNYVKQLITEPGYFRAEVERAVDADAKKNAVGTDVARTLRAELERLVLERSRIQTAFRKGLYTEDELATELETIERERAPLLNRLELSQMDERNHGARSARLAAADKRLASMRAAVETVDRDQQRAIIAELIERVTVDIETREVEIRVLVGDAPVTDESRVPGAAGGDGGADPAPHSSKGGRRPARRGSESYGSGLSAGSSTPHPRSPGRSRASSRQAPGGRRPPAAGPARAARADRARASLEGADGCVRAAGPPRIATASTRSEADAPPPGYPPRPCPPPPNRSRSPRSSRASSRRRAADPSSSRPPLAPASRRVYRRS
jgi:site-specific DNA recombinase